MDVLGRTPERIAVSVSAYGQTRRVRPLGDDDRLDPYWREVEYVPAEQPRGAVSANDDAFQVICDALSALHPPQARELMESQSYKAFAAFYKRGQ